MRWNKIVVVVVVVQKYVSVAWPRYRHFTVKLGKQCTEKISFMEFYCVAREKPIKCENSKLQTATVYSCNLVCGFQFCWVVLSFIVICQCTVHLSESNQSVHCFLTRTIRLMYRKLSLLLVVMIDNAMDNGSTLIYAYFRFVADLRWNGSNNSSIRKRAWSGNLKSY